MTKSRRTRAHWLGIGLFGTSLLFGEVFAAPVPKGKATDPAQRCIELAAGWRDKRPGIEFDDIKPQQAIPACEQAVQVHPEQPDLKAHLCRALRKAERFDEAVVLCRQAAEASSKASGAIDPTKGAPNGKQIKIQHTCT